jgi:hypothetical protein
MESGPRHNKVKSSARLLDMFEGEQSDGGRTVVRLQEEMCC